MDSIHAKLFRQNTLARMASIEGVGIHTGRRASLRLMPAPEDTGIVFRRVDCGIDIPASVENVTSLELATTLGRDDVTVSTVEHLLAALHIARIDNLLVEVDGPEVPILDGSALPYCRLIEAAGIRRQEALRKIMVVTRPLRVEVEDKSIEVTPHPGLRISYLLEYETPSIGRQTFEADISIDSFQRKLAAARTFALRSDVERLHAAGLGLGGREDNCVVFTDEGPLNTELRFTNEPVRHKALDAIGDLALLGAPIWGHVEVERGGHFVHFRLMEELLQRRECWTWAHGDATGAEMDYGDSDFERPTVHPSVLLS